MTFGAALELMKNGHKVTRAAWQLGVFVHYKYGAFELASGSAFQRDWRPNRDDMFFDDWKLS